jgi:hypothetical protein
MAARAEKFGIPLVSTAAPVVAAPALAAPKFLPRALTEAEQSEFDRLTQRALKFNLPNTAAEEYKKRIEQESMKEQRIAAQNAAKEQRIAAQNAANEQRIAAEKAAREARMAAKAASDEALRARALIAEEEKKRKRIETMKKELSPEEAARLEARAKRFAPST